MEKTTVKVTSSLLKGFVARAKALLNIDEEGQLTSFEQQVVKHFKSSIEKLEQNKNVLVLSYKSKVTDLKDLIEDAKDDLKNVWVTIDPTRIKSREDQKAYVDTYISKIEQAEEKVEKLEEELENLGKSHEEEINNISDQISEYKKKLNTFINL